MDNHALHPNPCLSISIGWRKRGQWLYRISKEVEELGWVDFDYDVPLILMLLCSSSLNRADSGTAKTKANSTQVRDLFGHPVESLRAMRMSAILICPTSNNRVILCYYGHANPRVKLSCFLPDIRIPHSNKTVHNIPHVQLTTGHLLFRIVTHVRILFGPYFTPVTVLSRGEKLSLMMF